LPCYNSIPEGDGIYEYWADDDRVGIIHFLDDIGQPLTCSGWGDHGESDIPPIVDDGALYTVRNWFPEDTDSGSRFPLTIFINHNKQIINITYGSVTFNETKLYIDCMLDAM